MQKKQPANAGKNQQAQRQQQQQEDKRKQYAVKLAKAIKQLEQGVIRKASQRIKHG